MSEHEAYFRAWRFDRARGCIVGVRPLDPDRLPRDHVRFVEDEQGRLLRLEEHHPDLELPAVKVLGYATEDGGAIVEALDYRPDGTLRLIHRYEYDALGRMSRRVELDGEGGGRGCVTSAWDGAGHEIEEAAYADDGSLRARHRYENDEQGRIVREQVFDAADHLQGTREIDYDAAGNVAEKRWFSAAGRLESRFVHTYDDGGNLTASSLYDGDGALRNQSVFTYDEVGNLISESS